MCYTKFAQDAQLSQRDRAAGCIIVFAKSSIDWNWETIIYGRHRSIFHHCDIIGLKTVEFREKRKIRASTAFKVIEVGTNRKPVCDFLLVINSN